MKGCDACDDHGGKPRDVMKAEGEARLTLLAAAASLGPVHPAELLLEAVRLTAVVLRWAAEQVDAGTMTVAKLDVVGEWLDRAGRLGKATADADSQDRWVRAQESVASRDADRVQTLFASALSKLDPPRSWDEPEVRAAFVAALDELAAGESG